MTLAQFASKRAATGAIVAGLVKALIVYLSLSDLVMSYTAVLKTANPAGGHMASA